MRHLRAGLAVCLLALPALASAQPADEDETGGGTVHESDEVIGPDGTEPAPPDDAPPPDDAAPAAPIATGGNTGYDKGFFIKSDDGKFSLKIKARVQPYLALTRSKTPAADWTGAFEVRRARLILEGNLHGDDLRYKIQTDFGKGNPSLKDWYADARLSGSTWVRAGQWKRPFSRQQITSSGKLELGDRAITDKGFGAGRDIGIALHNGYEDSPAIEWIVGVWNGTGDAASFAVDLTDPDDPAVSVKPAFRPLFSPSDTPFTRVVHWLSSLTKRRILSSASMSWCSTTRRRGARAALPWKSRSVPGESSARKRQPGSGM